MMKSRYKITVNSWFLSLGAVLALIGMQLNGECKINCVRL